MPNNPETYTVAPTGEGVKELLKMVLRLMPGWREAICELEDHCSEPVRLKNMIAATDQIDRLYPKIDAALQKLNEEKNDDR